MERQIGETFPLDIEETFQAITRGIGCASCIAVGKQIGEFIDGNNIYARYSMVGEPGWEALGDELPFTD